MSKSSYSFFGFSRRAKRRSAIVLIALWAMFSLSQALAACCGPPGGPLHGMTKSVVVAHSMDAVSDTDRKDSDSLPSDDSLPPSCPVVFDETAVLVSAQAATAAGNDFSQALVPPAPFVAQQAAVPRRTVQGGAYRSLPPPDPLYLRLQRFLI